ncbi:MAG: fimbria major subunit [Muribaculaceae bacterium]|nr:fimbria major subunit [Muribaculaceae bacterium]
MLLVLNSCVSEEDIEYPIEAETDVSFYLSLSLDTPTIELTRSTTNSDGNSSNGTEDGLLKENIISYASIYFYDADDESENKGNLLLSFTGSQNTPVEGNLNSYDIYIKLTLDQIRKLFSINKAHLYVIANGSASNYATETAIQSAKFNITTLNSKDSYARPFTIDNETSRLCPMSNKELFTVDLSAITITDDLSDADLVSAALSLFRFSYKDEDGNKANLWRISNHDGILNLERSIARVDYKYESNRVFDLTDTDWVCKGPNGETVKLELVAMQLFNVSKEAWMFRHTSQGNDKKGYSGESLAAGFAGNPFNNKNNNADYGKDITGDGEETGAKNYNYRWVVDTDWSKKTKENMKSPHLMTTEAVSFLNQSTVTEGTDRMTGETVYNWSIDVASETGTNGYTTYADLKTGNSSYASANRGYIPWHYVMENTLPTTSVMELPYATGVAFYLKVILIDEDNNEVTYPYSASEPLRITRNDGFYQEAQYDADKGGWYLTYKYLIEHNNDNTGKVDGNKGGKTDKAPMQNKAPMQIGIVRNNIYQLDITSISNLPDPHQPDNIDMTVDCFVLPWDVRWDDNVTLY